MTFYRQVTKNKTIEFQMEFGLKKELDLFNFAIHCRRKGDHAGFSFHIELFEIFMIDINFYDGRHWDYENNRYYQYDSAGNHI